VCLWFGFSKFEMSSCIEGSQPGAGHTKAGCQHLVSKSQQQNPKSGPLRSQRSAQKSWAGEQYLGKILGPEVWEPSPEAWTPACVAHGLTRHGSRWLLEMACSGWPKA
jgi:hypothetical protein